MLLTEYGFDFGRKSLKFLKISIKKFRFKISQKQIIRLQNKNNNYNNKIIINEQNLTFIQYY
jgi:hypothetical protein